jgi:hypothetical protein
MTIDLMALAKQADETYIDVDCSFGRVRVYHVPDAVLLSGSSGWNEPEQPMHTMKTATGVQERPSKKGDIEFDEWQKEIAIIREHSFRLRQAKGFVLSLSDIDWSQCDVSIPPPVKLAQNIYNGSWPEDDTLRKMIWLDFTLLSIRDDKDKILNAMTAMNEASEPSSEGVDEVKKNSA